MSLKIGITGGIGAGKSLVCKLFKTLGVPVYDADSEAKSLMVSNPELKEALIAAFGKETYLADGQVNRKFLADQVFNNETELKKLNSIVHPIVIQHGKDWAEAQTYPYSIKEAALLFESGSYKALDKIILVTAPEAIRIQRVMERDGVTEEQVKDRISKQMADADKQALADFILLNYGKTSLIAQVYELHQLFLKEANES
ncbi:dephospho-CoA kinase [Sphingobacterium hungaricum]